MKIGIISDTHGLIRPRLFEALAGVEHILHGGDVGPASILAELEAIAPVTAVWGNTDGFELRHRVPEVAMVTLDEVRCVVLHGHQFGSPTPEALAASHPGADLIVFGHTHRPEIREIDGVLTVNPGSCGPRRFDLKPTVVLAELQPSGITTELRELI